MLTDVAKIEMGEKAYGFAFAFSPPLAARVNEHSDQGHAV